MGVMGLVATWVLDCDQCSERVITEWRSENDPRMFEEEYWPPEGWIGPDEKGRFWCSDACCEAWILKHEGPEAAERFRNRVPMA